MYHPGQEGQRIVGKSKGETGLVDLVYLVSLVCLVELRLTR